jgi:hypothetical protein
MQVLGIKVTLLDSSRSEMKTCAPVFYLAVWVQGEHCEALLMVTVMQDDFSFHGKTIM